jgi:hypothetical protein
MVIGYLKKNGYWLKNLIWVSCGNKLEYWTGNLPGLIGYWRIGRPVGRIYFCRQVSLEILKLYFFAGHARACFLN